MNPELLLGDEAAALGAVHAGLSIAFSYPGTPASEIMEYLIDQSKTDGGFQAFWCVNEKVAYEEALGVSFTGKRTMVSMKHVGLNVAADPFMNSALTRINGGLVVVAADDPGMHSSQNEQDSRYYANFARIFCFEPSDHQEAYDMTREAFDISEKYNIPVMIRMVTRLSHSRSRIKPRPQRKQNEKKIGRRNEWTLLPVNARREFKRLVDSQPELIKMSNDCSYNRLSLEGAKGFIASGIGYNYLLENLQAHEMKPSILKIASYPLPETLIKKLTGHVDEIMVVEEGYPFIEERLKGLFGVHGKIIKGKLSGDLPLTGEMNPELIKTAFLNKNKAQKSKKEIKLPNRPPQLCQGCPHADTFNALNKVLEDFKEPVVFSDIGCYTLGALPPYKAVDTCVCMGASVSMTKGGSDAGLYPAVAVIGDSTFAHSGITPLLDAARANSNMTVLIVDNAAVAMTGGQPTFATGERLAGIAAGVGVSQEHIRTIIPLPKNFDQNIKVIKEEIEYPKLSVVISSRECIQEAKKQAKKGAK